jgi:hypothetical protein
MFIHFFTQIFTLFIAQNGNIFRETHKKMAAEEEIMKMRLLVDGDGTGKVLYYFPLIIFRTHHIYRTTIICFNVLLTRLTYVYSSDTAFSICFSALGVYMCNCTLCIV